MGIFRAKKGEGVRVLSLPAGQWLWETSMRDEFPDVKFEFTGIEEDPEVHCRLASSSALRDDSFRTTMWPTSVRDYVSTGPGQFDIIYYDWMGAWSDDKVSDIYATLEQNTLAVGGMLILTVSLNRGTGDELRILKEYPAELPCAFVDARQRNYYVSNHRVCGIPRRISDLAVSFGQVITPSLLEVYYPNSGLTSNASPQLRITLRREA